MVNGLIVGPVLVAVGKLEAAAFFQLHLLILSQNDVFDRFTCWDHWQNVLIVRNDDVEDVGTIMIQRLLNGFSQLLFFMNPATRYVDESMICNMHTL